MENRRSTSSNNALDRGGGGAPTEGLVMYVGHKWIDLKFALVL